VGEGIGTGREDRTPGPGDAGKETFLFRGRRSQKEEMD
jgi:hypothetical protein